MEQYGYMASFNMMIFLKAGFDPSQYPLIIQNIWKDMQDKGVIKKDIKTK